MALPQQGTVTLMPLPLGTLGGIRMLGEAAELLISTLLCREAALTSCSH